MKNNWTKFNKSNSETHPSSDGKYWALINMGFVYTVAEVIWDSDTRSFYDPDRYERLYDPDCDDPQPVNIAGWCPITPPSVMEAVNSLGL